MYTVLALKELNSYGSFAYTERMVRLPILNVQVVHLRDVKVVCLY